MQFALTFFWWISAHLNNPFYTKGAIGNFQMYQGAAFSAVPTGEAVLKAHLWKLEQVLDWGRVPWNYL